MEKPIRVRVLNRDFTLRVRSEDEAATRELAGYVDAKMKAFKEAHPEQPDLTAAIVTALALAEELQAAREAQERAAQPGAGLENELAALERLLTEALPPSAERSAR